MVGGQARRETGGEVEVQQHRPPCARRRFARHTPNKRAAHLIPSTQTLATLPHTVAGQAPCQWLGWQRVSSKRAHSLPVTLAPCQRKSCIEPMCGSVQTCLFDGEPLTRQSVSVLQGSGRGSLIAPVVVQGDMQADCDRLGATSGAQVGGGCHASSRRRMRWLSAVWAAYCRCRRPVQTSL